MSPVNNPKMQSCDEPEARLTPIQKFYKGSKVFVTGATGFLGCILIEKLLRVCCVDTIYVMIREKKGMDLTVRMDELLARVVFDKLRAVEPAFHNRVVGVYGDCALPGLGIGTRDRAVLIENINFVFHCAATVNFDENLRMATFINIRGTQEMLKLAKAMRRLIFFTHVSTAYVHCTRKQIPEEFLPSTYTAKQLITLAEELPEATIIKIQSIFVDKFPNTYAFTKTLSEQLIEEMDDFPIALFRPATIVPTYKEPLPGWSNNYYGLQGISAGAIVGLLHTLHCDPKVKANIVPVDMCANGMLAIAWNARQKYDKIVAFNEKAMEMDEVNLQRKKYKVPVYVCESNSTNPISCQLVMEYTQRYRTNYLTLKMMGVYFFNIRKNYYLNLLATIFLHYIPAFFCDLFLLCIGNKPRMIQAYKKMHKFSAFISYFCTQDWHFESRNYTALCNKMTNEDALLFFCDMRMVNWLLYFDTYILGCRLYLIKDPVETIPEAIRKQKRYKLATYFVLLLLAALLGFVVY